MVAIIFVEMQNLEDNFFYHVHIEQTRMQRKFHVSYLTLDKNTCKLSGKWTFTKNNYYILKSSSLIFYSYPSSIVFDICCPPQVSS